MGPHGRISSSTKLLRTVPTSNFQNLAFGPTFAHCVRLVRCSAATVSISQRLEIIYIDEAPTFSVKGNLTAAQQTTVARREVNRKPSHPFGVFLFSLFRFPRSATNIPGIWTHSYTHGRDCHPFGRSSQTLAINK